VLDPAAMWIIGIAVTVLPFVLAYAFHGTEQADSRGRKINTKWRGRSLRG
jgi:hypothetical protein